MTTRPILVATLVLLLALGAVAPASAQRRTATDAQIVDQATLVAAGDRVEIYQHGVAVAPAFLKAAEDAYRRLEALTGRTLDTATLGPKVRIYVSDAVRISHVWRDYQHPTDPKGIVLLSARAYDDGLKRINATYVHEMAHLFTWRYHSHTLREGLAECLGTTKPAPAWLTSDADRRRAYYFASYRFVKYLVEQAGMDVFMRLYDASNTVEELARPYGASREELVRRAGI